MNPNPPLIYFHRLALDELVAARRWYANQSARAAQRFQLAVEAAVRRIQSMPTAGVLFQASYRWVKVRRFPYLLYYGPIANGIIEVFAVAHGGRRPGYWLGRPRHP